VASGDQPANRLAPDRGDRRLKTLDRVLGIPAVTIAGSMRRLRPRHLAANWRRLGLVNTAGIGDAVLSSAIVHDVRVARPDAHVVMFATATNQGFATLIDGLDGVVCLPVRDLRQAIRLVRAERLDVCVDLGAWPRYDALMTALSGAGWTVGRRTPGQRRHLAYDQAIRHCSDEHELANFRRLIAAIGIDSTSAPSISVSGRPEIADPYAVFHLWPGGANAAERSWPLSRWESLAARLNDRGLLAVLTGGPGDVSATESIVDRWGRADVRALSAAGSSPSDCARWLVGAVGAVCVNTGVMHLAAAVGCATVGLHGPTRMTRWGPVGARVISVVSPDVPTGYLDLGFERNDELAGCMDAITVESVLRAWDQLTSDPSGSPRMSSAT
jgi:heptosyltransferase I